MYTLNHSYPAIAKQGSASDSFYGGNQIKSSSKMIRRYGCGVISCLDLLLYICRSYPICPIDLFEKVNLDKPIPIETYDGWAQQLCRQYFPILPRLGLNVFVMALGLNRCFKAYRIPLHARWGVAPAKLWARIRDMLSQDLPVILAIGQNFPFPWQKAKCGLYKKNAEGIFCRVSTTKAHYVNVTGIDETWVRVSSWGQMLFLNRNEYSRYIAQHSNALFSNILYLEKRSSHMDGRSDPFK